MELRLSGVLRDRYKVGSLRWEAEGYAVYEGTTVPEGESVFLISYDTKAASFQVVTDLAFWLAHGAPPLLPVLEQWIEWHGQMVAFPGFVGISVYRMVEFSITPYSDEFLLPLIPRFLDICERLYRLQVVLPSPDEMLRRIIASAGGEFSVFPLLLIEDQDSLMGASPFQHGTEPPPPDRYIELFGSLCGYCATKTRPSQGLVYRLSEVKHLSDDLRAMILGGLDRYRTFGEIRRDLARFVPLK